MQIKFKNNSDNPSPKYGSQFAAGFDIAAHILTENRKITIKPSEQELIATGLFMEVPHGYYLQLKSRSGLAKDRNLHVTAGVIDSDYRGQIHVLLINHSKQYQVIDNGDRIAQGIILPYIQAQFELVNELTETMRGDGGFGSTGIGGEQSKALVKDEVKPSGINLNRLVVLSELKVGDSVYLRSEGFTRLVEDIESFGISVYSVRLQGFSKSIDYSLNGYCGAGILHANDIISIVKA